MSSIFYFEIGCCSRIRNDASIEIVIFRFVLPVPLYGVEVSMNIRLGQVVYSKAGRDEGRIFVITEIIDDKYVFVSDGDLRRVENPKKKKLKHLEISSDNIEAISLKLTSSMKITNAEIRKSLAEIQDSQLSDNSTSADN